MNLVANKDEILRILNEAGIRHKDSDKYINVVCPLHSHTHKNKLHLGIHVSGRYLHCWSYPTEGDWNTYAEAVGLKKLDLQAIDVADLSTDEVKPHRIKLPVGLEPWTGDIRRFGNGPDIKAKTLERLKVHKWYDPKSRVYRPLFEVDDYKGKLVGWFTLRDNEKAWPKVRNMTGHWAKQALFPLYHPIIRKSEALFLVEGPVDAIRMISLGLPALCIFGVSNWSKRKLNTILMLKKKYIYITMDPDAAGKAITKQIYKESEGLIVAKDIRLREKTDPGNAPKSDLVSLSDLPGVYTSP